MFSETANDEHRKVSFLSFAVNAHT